MTKLQNYTAMRALVADNAELTAFIDHEIELLQRKNSKTSAAAAKKAAYNANLRQDILAELINADKPMTCSEVAAVLKLNTQKVAPQMTALVNDGQVARTVVKRVAYFSVIWD